MATTIDELVVTLGLDPTNFSKGQREALDDFKKTKDAAKRTASDMEADGKQAARFYGQIKSEALSLIAVLVGAGSIEKFLSGTVTSLAAVGRIATVMGMATPDVIAIGMAVERLDGNAQEAQKSLLGLSQTLQGWKLGEKPSQQFLQAFGFIGGGVNDSPLQVLQKFATWSQGKDPRLVEQIGSKLGLNQDLINEAIQGRGKLDADIAQSYKNGIPSDGDIKKVTDLQKAFFNLAQSIKFAGTELVVDVADPLTHLLNLVTQLTHDFPGATKLVLGLVAALIALKTVGVTMGVARALTGGGVAAVAGGGAEGAGLGAGGLVVAGVVGGTAASSIGSGIGPPAALGGLVGDAGLATSSPATRAALTHGALGPILAAMATTRSGVPAVPAGGASTVAGRAAEAQAYLQAGGFTADQSRGIVAALMAETVGTLSPTIKNPTSTAYGLAQWVRSSGRQDLFRQVIGRDLHGSSFEQQLQFLMYELTHGQSGAARAIKGAATAGAAAGDFIHLFEAPGAYGEAVDARNASRYLGGSTVTIGTLVVQTQATDAKGIARTVKRELATTLAANTPNGPT